MYAKPFNGNHLPVRDSGATNILDNTVDISVYVEESLPTHLTHLVSLISASESYRPLPVKLNTQTIIGGLNNVSQNWLIFQVMGKRDVFPLMRKSEHPLT